MIRYFTGAAQRLHRDQRGQGLVFAALSFLIVIMAVTMVYNIGQVCMTRIKVQTAADSAALSAAMIQANCFSTIGWVNNGMAQIYHSLLRQMADITTFAVLAEFEDPGGHIRAGREAAPPEGYPCSPEVLWGVQSTYGGEIEAAPAPGFACTKLKELTDRAEIVFPEAKRWLMELSHIEQAIALAGPILIDDEIDRIVGDAGATHKSVFFGSRWYPLNDKKIDMLIERLEAEDGWNVEVWESGEVSKRLEIRHPSEKVWSIRNIVGVDEDTTLQIEMLDDEGNEWLITKTPPGDVIHCKKAKTDDDEDLNFWIITTYGPGKPRKEIKLKKNTDLGEGAYDMIVDGQRVDTYRRSPLNGDLEIYRGGEWINITEHERDGVRVQLDFWVKISEGLSVHLVNPPAVHFSGTTVNLRSPVNFRHHVSGVTLTVVNHFAIGVYHETLTAADADGRWRKHYREQEDFWWQQRLTPDPDFPDTKWIYNFERLGSLLTWESNRYRLGLHQALRWNFSDYPDWGTFDAAVGPETETSDLPEWVYWMGLAPTEGDEDVGMTFEAKSPKNRPWEMGYEPPDSEYYQIRECWYCGGSGEKTRMVEEPPGSGTLVEETYTCPVCQAYTWGRTSTHVCVRPEDTRHRNSGADSWKNFIKLELAKNDSYGVEGKVREPLVLTEEFFKYGMNVAVWANPWPGLDTGTQREDPKGSSLKPILLSPLTSDDEADMPRLPDWGCMAVASARAGFHDPDLEEEDVSGEMESGFVWRLKGLEYVRAELGHEPDDDSERRLWLDGKVSPGNLYVTRWAAKLVATKNNIDVNDLKLEGHELEGRFSDSAAGWLYDMFATGRSFRSSKLVKEFSLKPVPNLRAMRRRDGRRLEYGDLQAETDIRFEDVLFH